MRIRAAEAAGINMLPKFQATGPTPTAQDFMLMQSQWKSKLDPLLGNPLNSASILSGVVLKNGTNVINHLLGQMMRGWTITDINGAATIYRSAPLNEKTLTLTSNAAVTVNIEVF